MFEWTREPQPEWVASLAAISPSNPQVPWLKLVWEPGDPWKPVQRWEIREMYPNLALVERLPGVLDALRGPNPRESGFFSQNEQRWISDSPISRMQWLLFQETGCYAVRFWVIQGDRGGHPFKLSDVNQRFLQLLGREQTDTPAPGALPYCEPNALTWAGVAEYDKLRKWQYASDWTNRTRKTEAGLWVQREGIAAEEEYGEQMLRFLDTVIDGALDEIPRSRLPGESEWPEPSGPAENPELVERDLLTAVSTPRSNDEE